MEFIIPPEYDGSLLREFLRGLPFISGGILTQLKRTENGITVNGEQKTVRYKLSAGDVVRLRLDAPGKTDVEPVDIPLDIIYEDDDMIAVNKPSGMPTHTSHNHHYDTLSNALAYYYRDRDFVFRAVNRLDNPTSGVVLVAKNRPAAYMLADQFFRKQAEKVYCAVCHGFPEPESGTVSKSIRRQAESVIIRSVCDDGDGRACVTDYATEKKAVLRGEKISLIRLLPHTGRTHQIRLHMAYIGVPVVGDDLYGDGYDAGLGRLALHAASLRIKRCSDGNNILLEAPIPKEFTDLFYEQKDNRQT
ncbi:MAG: RluA family pseudouridine synthase [Clostridia bacterium]|nr:RluA family pseudouridine synthase [Clostridia bacterium]